MPKISVTKSSAEWITDPQQLEAINRRIRECLEEPDAGDSDVDVLTDMLNFLESRNCFSIKQLNFLSKIEEYIDRRSLNQDYYSDVNGFDDDLPF